MGDQEETLILNYIEEEFDNAQENDVTNTHNQDQFETNSTGSFDENRNKKNEAKCKTDRRKISANNKTKHKEQKTGKFKEETDSNLLLSTLPQIEIKKEKDLEIETPNLHQNLSGQCQEVAVKYETVEQIHEEFKYESRSEGEDNLKNAAGKNRRKSQTSRVLKQKGVYEELRNKIARKLNENGQTKNVINIVDDTNGSKNSTKKHIFSCYKCLYIGNSKANLERHTLIHLDPTKIKWYSCSECPYRSKYDFQLKSHVMIHKKPDEIIFFNCPSCEFKCTRKHNLTNHIKSVHADRDYSLKCAECNFKTFSKDRLVAHVKKHSKELFSCKKCKFVTKRRSYLEYHFKSIHSGMEKSFPCDTCSYKGKSQRELDRHYGRMHNKEKLQIFRCIHCDFNSIYKKNLEFHLLHMHQNSEGFQKFVCGHCERDFAYKSGLKVHIVRCHLKMTEEDWHKCMECTYKSKDKNTLKRHARRNHCAPRLQCKQCSFTTNRQISMDAHKKSHEFEEDQDIFKCPECPYRALQISSFVYHMKVIHGKAVSAKNADQYYLKND